jgi:hypothetical protein
VLSDAQGEVDLDGLRQDAPRHSVRGSSLHPEEIQDVTEGDPGEEGEHQHGTRGDKLSLNAPATHLSEQSTQEERRDTATIKWRNRQQIQHREVC